MWKSAVLLSLLLSACAVVPPVYHHWTIPHGNQQTMNSDWYQCVRENTKQGTVVDSHGSMVEVNPRGDVDDGMAVQCMRAKGYTLTGTDSRG